MTIKTLKRDMVGYKTVNISDGKGDRVRALVKLRIPKGTKVFTNANRTGKCRAEKALVLSVKKTKIDDSSGYGIFVLLKKELKKGTKTYTRLPYYAKDLQYTKGRIARPHNGFDLRDTQCASGIHFYRTLARALNP